MPSILELWTQSCKVTANLTTPNEAPSEALAHLSPPLSYEIIPGACAWESDYLGLDRGSSILLILWIWATFPASLSLSFFLRKMRTKIALSLKDFCKIQME